MAFAWDTEHPIMTGSPFTWVNSPVDVADLHNADATKTLVPATGHRASSTDKTIAVGDTHFTIGCYVWVDATPGDTQHFLTTINNSPGTDNYLYINVQPDGRVGCTYQGNALFKQSQSAIGDMSYAEWLHYIFSINMATGDINIYKNGVEATYSTDNAGTLTGVSMADRAIGVGSQYINTFAQGLSGSVSRLKISSGTTTGSIITSAEAATEYAAELALLGDAYNPQVLLTTLFS